MRWGRTCPVALYLLGLAGGARVGSGFTCSVSFLTPAVNHQKLRTETMQIYFLQFNRSESPWADPNAETSPSAPGTLQERFLPFPRSGGHAALGWGPPPPSHLVRRSQCIVSIASSIPPSPLPLPPSSVGVFLIIL